MKIGRNELCPCGSGKKYKKCCMLKKQAEPHNEEFFEDDDESLDDHDFEEDTDELAKHEFAIEELIHSIHRIIIDRNPRIKKYKKIRKLHSEVVTSMVNYYNKGSFVLDMDQNYVPPAIPVNEKKLRNDTVMLAIMNANFDTETREGTQAMFDMLIYKMAPNLNCITEEYIKKNKYRKPEKKEFLQCMLNSVLGLFTITGVIQREGYAYLKNVFTGREYEVTDVGLSGNINSEGTYIYTRLITYDGVTFGTGLSLLFEKDDKFIIDFIKKEKKDYQPILEFKRFFDIYNRYSSSKKRIDVIANKYM